MATDGQEQSSRSVPFVGYKAELQDSNSSSSTSPGSLPKDGFDSQGNRVSSPLRSCKDALSPGAGYMTPRSPVSVDFPSPSRVLPNSSLGLAGAFEFPEDYTYFEYSAGGSFASISRVLPLAELFQSEPVSPHVYNAAIALAALTLSSSEQYRTGSMTLRRHAFHHSLKAVQGLQKELTGPHQGAGASSSSSTALRADTALSLFATIMLAANFELQRGSVLSWYSHMRGAASCLNAAHAELLKKPTGMLLIRAFARMALLLRLYNEDYSVTTPGFMSPHLATWLNGLLRDSSRPHDQMLLLVEEVTALEIQKRQHPALDSTWTVKSADLLRRLERWRTHLPSSELPVDDSTTNGAFLTVSSSHYSPTTNGSNTPNDNDDTSTESLIRIPALHFPDSPDPCVSAVNYATYLCTRMRALTRYPNTKNNNNSDSTNPGPDRELPPNTEQTALAICRIAAANPPARFGASFTYSYGMLPSVVGAYRWSDNPGLRSWAKHWLTGYRTTREGIWNVSHTLRLIAAVDPVHRMRPSRRKGQERAFVALRTVDEPVDPSPELEEGDVKRPFKIVMSTRGENEEGASSNVVTVK